MRILITGVAGFIGSNLASRLLGLGYDVTGVDNFTYGHERNISVFRTHTIFRFIKGALESPECLYSERADIIVHLASQKIPRYTNSHRTLEDNLNNLRKIVSKCISDKSRLIYASTSDVYGKNPEVPFTEESSLVLGPTNVKRWAYAVSKIHGEHYIIACSDEFGLEYTIARFFGAYGPNQNLTWWGGPQSVFIAKSLNREEMEIHGDGRQTRTFTYIDDTVDALVRIIENRSSDNNVFNVGTTENCEISVVSLATMIWKMIHGQGSEPPLKFIPYASFGNYEDVMARVPDITKIRNMLGFNPVWGLEEGMKKTIEWQKRVSGL